MDNHSLEENKPVETGPRKDVKGQSWIIGLTSLFFILLQSACVGDMRRQGWMLSSMALAGRISPCLSAVSMRAAW